MSYLLRGAALSLAWFALVNVATSAATALAANALIRANQRQRRRPRLWLAMRLLPALASTAFVAAVFVPSYLQFEPRDAGEGFDLLSTLCAALAVAIAGAGLVRAAAAVGAARRRVRLWLRDARPMTIDAASIPIYELDVEQPIIALTGVFRPRLLVTRGLLGVLNDAELSAAIAHEVGHRRAFDNLKRLAMRAAPDLLCGSAAARAIERQWMSAAEHAADRLAADGADARCALASALVKVARFTPAAIGAAEPISTLIGGGEIASRVQELLEESPQVPRRPRAASAWIGVTVLLASAVILYAPILRAVHEATEVLVRIIP
jgi:Zn-dependent protease with chaperone function